MNFKSGFLQELESRGFIAQITHSKELDDVLFASEESYKNGGSERFSAYIGFDCTAQSLHVGSLIQIMILRLLQKHGHAPIALLGGGTTKIGDPSGKDEARQILTEEKIQQNLEGIKNTLAKFISFGDDLRVDSKVSDGAKFNNGFSGGNNSASNSSKALARLVNNDDWLKNLNYIEFLRDVGRHFSVNRMLTFDSVKTRLERDQPLSFLEFNYMILQAYDFYELNKSEDHKCSLQIGGSDQWGNIVNGVDLIRRMPTKNSQRIITSDGAIHDSPTNAVWSDAKNHNPSIQNSVAFGLTSPLLTTADGKKMGKTANGAVWLDANMLSPFDYFQYFRNTHDADVVRFLKLFTDLPLNERNISSPDKPCIAELEKLKDQEINKAKEILAFEVTKICHGEETAQAVLQKAREIFISKNSTAYEEKEIAIGEGKKLTEIIKEIGAVESNAEAKRLIEGRGVKINDQAVADTNRIIKEAQEFNLAVGKKKFFKIICK